MDEASPGNGRTSVRHHEVADGPSPFLGERAAQGQRGAGVGCAELQLQTGDQHPGGSRPAAGAGTLLSLRGIFASPQTARYLSVGKSRLLTRPGKRASRAKELGPRVRGD